MNTSLYFRQYKKEKLYTVESDQTQRDPVLGELEETAVNRDSGFGIISLGAKVEDINREEKKDMRTVRRNKVFEHIALHREKSVDELAEDLSMSKKTLVPLLAELEKSLFICSTGTGKKGNPKKWRAAIDSPEMEMKEIVCK